MATGRAGVYLSAFTLITISNLPLMSLADGPRPMNDDFSSLSNFKLINRHRITTTPCDIGALSSSSPDLMGPNLGDRVQKRLNLLRQEAKLADPASYSSEKLNGQTDEQTFISCDESERISLLSLEDNSQLGGLSSDLISSRKEVVEQLCNVRLRLVEKRKYESPNSFDIIGEYSEVMHLVDGPRFLQACKNYLEYEMSLFERAVRDCNYRQNCQLEVNQTREQVSKIQDFCFELASHDLAPILRLNYICLPNEQSRSRANRTVRFQDVPNTVACRSRELLYLHQVTINFGSTNCREASKHDNCQLPYDPNSPYSIGYFDNGSRDDSKLEDFRRRNAIPQPVNLDDNRKSTGETQTVPPGPFDGKRSRRDTRSQGGGHNDYYLNHIPKAIFELCHANASCSLDLMRLTKSLCLNHGCLFDPRILANSFITMDYQCTGDDKFGPKYSESPAALNVVVEYPNKTTAHNSLDYDNSPEFITELGRIKWSTLGDTHKARDGSSRLMGDSFNLTILTVASMVIGLVITLRKNLWSG